MGGIAPLRFPLFLLRKMRGVLALAALGSFGSQKSSRPCAAGDSRFDEEQVLQQPPRVLARNLTDCPIFMALIS